ncbi:hypothetical protein [Kangiella koreensis]|uniref:Uncharacterized protein n=1 Tax=Kangiella koreensis (strain DSM 16069 / JCM 12317 / KCTC 12182 / SW-125) TaxID=523791 RepID=C7R5U3_KANKD|nr:hypothetical protein [Kangiella koreensis]ACV27267.1 hypothetical protein Kkor_1855 [Kangiella koreensis DSM 16069]
MSLETRLKETLVNHYAWPVGREHVQRYLEEVLPREPCSLCYRIPKKGYSLPFFKDNNIQPLAVLLIDTKLKSYPYAFEDDATILPCTIEVFAVPKNEVEKTKKVFDESLLSKLGKRIKNRVTCTVWFGLDQYGKVIEKQA